MKKFLLMKLMVVAYIFASSACSDDSSQPKPDNEENAGNSKILIAYFISELIT